MQKYWEIIIKYGTVIIVYKINNCGFSDSVAHTYNEMPQLKSILEGLLIGHA